MVSKKDSKKRDTSKSRSQKSPAREKSKSPAKKSPSRTKSPSRKSPSRGRPPKSGGTVSKSPTRRSPARTTKTPEKQKTEPSKAPKKITYDSDSDNLESVQEVKEKPKAAVRGRTRPTEPDQFKGYSDYFKEEDIKPSNTVVLRRSARSSRSTEVERVVHLSQKLSEFSDDDDPALSKQVKSNAEENKSAINGIIFDILLPLFGIIGFPVFVYSLHIFCNEKQCSFNIPANISIYKYLSTYFHLQSFLLYFAFIAFLALLSLLPLGGKKSPDTANQKFYFMTKGFASFTVCAAVHVVLLPTNFELHRFLVEHTFYFIFPSIVLGLLLSIFAYIRSFYVPTSALTTSSASSGRIRNFLCGRELNPKIFGVFDLKMFINRACIILAMLLCCAVFFNHMEAVPKLNLYGVSVPLFDTTFIAIFFMVFIYLGDGLVYENALATTRQIQADGFGYIFSMGYLLYPFMAVLYVKYPLDHRLNLPAWAITAAALIFIFGFFLYRGSNVMKDQFRRNPYGPDRAWMETIPTTQGKHLLLSGPWGIVRHPNYLGDILVHAAFLFFVYDVPPVFVVLLTYAVLLIRSVQDGKDCKQKYGTAWDRYCQRVKYVLIPKVY